MRYVQDDTDGPEGRPSVSFSLGKLMPDIEPWFRKRPRRDVFIASWLYFRGLPESEREAWYEMARKVVRTGLNEQGAQDQPRPAKEKDEGPKRRAS